MRVVGEARVRVRLSKRGGLRGRGERRGRGRGRGRRRDRRRVRVAPPHRLGRPVGHPGADRAVLHEAEEREEPEGAHTQPQPCGPAYDAAPLCRRLWGRVRVIEVGVGLGVGLGVGSRLGFRVRRRRAIRVGVRVRARRRRRRSGSGSSSAPSAAGRSAQCSARRPEQIARAASRRWWLRLGPGFGLGLG